MKKYALGQSVLGGAGALVLMCRFLLRPGAFVSQIAGMVHTAFILGAGLGTRLRPLTEHCPKPLLPVAGRPMLCHLLDRLAGAGVARFIINTHHCAEAYAVAFPHREWAGRPLCFVHEPVLLDTGGGLKNIEPLLGAKDDALLVCNGDIFAEPDFGALVQAHATTRAEAMLLLRTHGEPLNVRMSATGEIVDMRGCFGRGDAAGKNHLFAGTYCVSRAFLGTLAPGKIESVVEAFLRRILEKPGSIRGLVDDSGYWHDLGTHEEYLHVCQSAAREMR
ncbi:MAG: NTP transferase domain-containing protein [Puniceicoccales bacterium]|jgi:NDP-sugar pyrophosphorylase family protein|nr:NTP transferase domain-containing protein [Puniceicoccales bacterium]